MSGCDGQGPLLLLLQGWSFRWQLRGTEVRCNTCGELQEVIEAIQPFVHASGCWNKDDQPWQDLEGVLHELPTAPAV
jgi:hypothetical protein